MSKPHRVVAKQRRRRRYVKRKRQRARANAALQISRQASAPRKPRRPAPEKVGEPVAAPLPVLPEEPAAARGAEPRSAKPRSARSSAKKTATGATKTGTRTASKTRSKTARDATATPPEPQESAPVDTAPAPEPKAVEQPVPEPAPAPEPEPAPAPEPEPEPEPEPPPEQPPAEPAFDLSAELGDLFGAQPAVADEPAPAAGTDLGDQALSDIFREFQKGVDKQLGKEDYETRYNLGIAYKEMGLVDEAIAEFQLAAKDEKRLLECSSMLGICFLEKGMPKLAVKWFEKGLAAPGRSDEEYQALRYDLANALEQAGDRTKALSVFTDLYGQDASFRDVAEKVRRLQER